MIGGSVWFLLPLGIFGLVGAWSDITQRKLENRLCLAILLTGLVASFLIGGWHQAGSALLHAAIALIGGMALFGARVLGGGDAKFYAGFAAWFSLQDGLYLLVSVAISGLAVLVAWMIWRRLPRKQTARLVGIGEQEQEEELFAKLPYGVAIALGAVVAFAMIHAG